MRRIKTVSLIGLGAIGSAYGSRLHTHLREDFTVVANQERISRYQKNGIRVLDETYHFHYETPDTKSGPRDLVIFTVKNAELKQAIEEVRHHIGTDTIILSLLNGVSSEDAIYEATGNKHILPSMCVGIDAVRKQESVRFSSLGKICFGAGEKSTEEDVQAVRELFEDASLPYEIPENIQHAIWAKFMFNVGINQISAVLKASYDYFQHIPTLHEWMEDAMYEVVAIAEKIGIGLSVDDVKSYRPILDSLSPNSKTSMLQDIEGSRKTEVEFFAGKVVELGIEHNIPTPINNQLLRIIPIIEKMNQFDKERSPVNI